MPSRGHHVFQSWCQAEEGQHVALQAAAGVVLVRPGADLAARGRAHSWRRGRHDCIERLVLGCSVEGRLKFGWSGTALGHQLDNTPTATQHLVVSLGRRGELNASPNWVALDAPTIHYLRYPAPSKIPFVGNARLWRKGMNCSSLPTKVICGTLSAKSLRARLEHTPFQVGD